MKKKFVATCGTVLGLGSAGYYLYRSYAHSDHSLRGALRQCRQDMTRDFAQLSRGAQRVGSWTAAAIEKVRRRSHEGRRPREDRERPLNSGREKGYRAGEDALSWKGPETVAMP